MAKRRRVCGHLSARACRKCHRCGACCRALQRRTRRQNPPSFKIIVWHGEGRSLFYVQKYTRKHGSRIVKTFHSRAAAEDYIRSKGGQENPIIPSSTALLRSISPAGYGRANPRAITPAGTVY